MEERAGTGGSTSLKGLRKHRVAAAQAIAQESLNQSSFRFLQSQLSSTRSVCKPVPVGSVLKCDVKQKLVKERREEMRRRQDALKEMQLLEKERKSKLQYEKQMETKQRKLREQKEKDEQRRISAEEKRKQKLQEETERFNAVLCRIFEQTNFVDKHQKRWSMEGSTTVKSERKTVNKQSISIEKPEQKTSGLHKQTTVSSVGLQNSVAKNKTGKRIISSLNRRYSNLCSPVKTEQLQEESVQQVYAKLWENNVIMHLIAPTKASIAKSKNAASLSVPGKISTPGLQNPVIQYIKMPLLIHSSGKQRNNIVLGKSSLAMHPCEKVEIPPKGSVEVAHGVSMEPAPEVSMEEAPGASMETLPESVETSPEGSMHTSSLMSLDSSPEVSTDSFFEVNMDPSPEVSMHSFPDMNMDGSSVASVDWSYEFSMKAFHKVSMETILEESVRVSTMASMEASPELLPNMSTDSSSKISELNRQASDPITKRRQSSHIPCYKSSTSGWHTPSAITAHRQNQKNRSPSLSSIMSKQSTQSPLSSKITPVRHTLFAQNVLGTIRKKNAVTETANSSVAVNQKHVTCEESGNKSTPGTMNAKKATKILAEKRCPAYEKREKEERLQKEMKHRKKIDMAKKAVEGQEEFSKLDDGQRQKEIKNKKEFQDQEDQKMLLQKGYIKIKAQEEAYTCKKEHERTILLNLQERLERKKTVEATYNEICEGDEADDEETESDDEDSFSNSHPSAFSNSVDLSTKHKMNLRNVKKNIPKLVFLDPTSTQICKEPKSSFKSTRKNFRQNVKDPLTKAKSTRLSTKRMTNQTAKTIKTIKNSNTTDPSKNLYLRAQEWICDRIQDSESEIESLTSSILPDSPKHDLKDSTIFHQSPQTSSDETKRNQSDSDQSDI